MSSAKKKTIRGILIDAEHCTVREVEFENTLESYYRLLNCTCVTAPSYDGKHDVIIDDEGLLNGKSNFFELSRQEVYAGNGLIVGVDPSQGDWRSHSLSVESIRSQVCFVRFLRIGKQLVKCIIRK